MKCDWELTNLEHTSILLAYRCPGSITRARRTQRSIRSSSPGLQSGKSWRSELGILLKWAPHNLQIIESTSASGCAGMVAQLRNDPAELWGRPNPICHELSDPKTQYLALLRPAVARSENANTEWWPVEAAILLSLYHIPRTIELYTGSTKSIASHSRVLTRTRKSLTTTIMTWH